MHETCFAYLKEKQYDCPVYLSNFFWLPRIYPLYLCVQLLLRSKTMYFAEGTILGGSNDKATGLMVITSGQVSPLSKTGNIKNK